MENAYHEDSFHDDQDTDPPPEGAGIATQLAIPLGDVPRRDLLAVAPHTRVGEVIREMNERSIGCALVVDRDALVGIFTERDVLRKVAASGMDVKSIAVSEVMTAKPDVLPEEATVAFALNRMSVEGYRHIPLVDAGGKPVGVVGMRDIISWLVEMYPNEVLTIPPAPVSFRTREGA